MTAGVETQTHGFDNSFDMALIDEFDVFEECLPPEEEDYGAEGQEGFY